MKKIVFHLVCLFATIFSINGQATVYESFHPGALWYDNNGKHINAHGGGILVAGDTYYWFGEHKTEGKGGNVASVGVHCYSSKDLYNWKDEGIALSVAPDGSGSDIEKGCILERPKVIYNKNTGKYIMWFHLELKGKGYASARSGIAIADRPAGPYKFIRSVRSNPGHWPVNAPASFRDTTSMKFFIRDFEQGQMQRDMTLFVDDDGKAYHIYASEENRTLQIAELSGDYLSHTGKYVRAFPGRFMEAPAIFKKDGKYYMIMSGCTGWKPNAARSAVAPSVWGPWTELGNPCIGENAELTFDSQSTYILHIPDSDKYIFMADRWKPDNAIDGRYVWLKIQFDGDRPILKWEDKWNIEHF